MKTILALSRRPNALILFGLVIIIMALAIAKLYSKSNNINIDSAQELTQLFDEHQYNWPPTAEIPSIFIERFPDDMDVLQASDRKATFFRAILPLILEENAVIQAERAMLLEIIDQDLIQGQALVELNILAEKYGLDGDVTNPEIQHEFKRRVDIIPPALALAQAATESAWGTSRFSVDGNNLFGEWTYKKGEGLIPKDRAKGKKHYVRKFKDLQSSIRSYINNLNRGHAYVDLRRMRAAMRQDQNSIEAKDLTSGLMRYSSRGNDYVTEIQTIIRQNKLDKIDFHGEVFLPSG